MAKEIKEIDVFTMEGDKKSVIQLDVSDINVKKASKVVSDVVNKYMANQKKHTACVKTRSEVAYSTRKVKKQKGTGGARAGGRGNPIWVGGGVAFGPKPRNVRYDISKKLKKNALSQAMLLKIIDDGIVIIDDLKFEETKTKAVTALLKNLNIKKSVLIVTDSMNSNLVLSVRNIQKVKAKVASELNAHDVLLYSKLLFTKTAFENMASDLIA